MTIKKEFIDLYDLWLIRGIPMPIEDFNNLSSDDKSGLYQQEFAVYMGWA